jgi:hypothetical protein
MIPQKAPAMMADPAFDSKAFYLTHETERASRDNNRVTRDSAKSAPVAAPGPVARLNASQTYNAFIIVEVGKEMKLPKKAYVIAIATVIQETNLRNLANSTVPASLNLPHEGVGDNYDSVGLFQQRPSMGWGTVEQLMEPSQSAARFYSRLMKISGWQSLSVGSAAQTVQRSAYPDAYADHASHAQEIVDALLRINP